MMGFKKTLLSSDSLCLCNDFIVMKELWAEIEELPLGRYAIIVTTTGCTIVMACMVVTLIMGTMASVWAATVVFPQPRSIPFLVIQDPDWKNIPRALENYEKATHRALETLSFAIETLVGDCDDRDNNLLLVTNLLQDKIERLEHIYSKDLAVLKDIVTTFPCQYMLPSQPFPWTEHQNTKSDRGDSSHPSAVDPLFPRQQDFSFVPLQKNETLASYESVMQVVIHLVRDWSHLGSTIRSSLYDFCCNALAKYSVGLSRNDKMGPILVPGAGLGRLAWMIASNGYIVEALESSTLMAAGAYAMYHHGSKPQRTIHPFAADPFLNEVNASQRYMSCTVPDITTSTIGIDHRGGSLTYTVAKFDLAAVPQKHYAAVVTCFFLDTATTLVDYVSTIQAVLKNDGLWINVGPLHWHQNSRVPLAVDELKVLLTKVYNFTVLQWSVDENVVNYRDSRTTGSTFSDGYRPLRFILRCDGT